MYPVKFKHGVMNPAYRHVSSAKLERWLGTERIEHISKSMSGYKPEYKWYGRPIALLDVPGGVKVTRDGDFIGKFERGGFMSAMDSLEAAIRQSVRCALRVPHGQLNAGFTSISDALSRASQGFAQRRSFNKVGPTGVVGVSSSLWRVGPSPAVGTAPASAAAGTAFDRTTTGALEFANPAAGTLRLTGADVGCNVVGNTLLYYDLIYGVNKTMNSTTNESVTGVPTRYTSNTPSDEDFAGDNFLFIQVGGTALAATAHNWNALYRDQDGNDNVVLPTLTGNASAIVDRLDHPAQQWFAPLATGDCGIEDLAEIDCSAAVATGVIWFMIGHPIGFMAFPAINMRFPFDWLTNRDQAPRIFDNACPAFMEITKPATTATTYTGRMMATSTSS